MADRTWEIVSSEYVVESPWYRLRRDVCRLPDGSVVDSYYVREHPGFAVIFAITPDGDVLLVRQYKHGAGESVLELPAGAIDPDESPLACARRELEEETGYRAESFRIVAEFITDPASSTSRLHLFVAEGAKPDGVRALDPTEEIDVVLVPLDRVLDEVRLGRVRAQSHVASIYTVLDRLGRLKLSISSSRRP